MCLSNLAQPTDFLHCHLISLTSLHITLWSTVLTEKAICSVIVLELIASDTLRTFCILFSFPPSCLPTKHPLVSRSISGAALISAHYPLAGQGIIFSPFILECQLSPLAHHRSAECLWQCVLQTFYKNNNEKYHLIWM